jgi:hypothetical protein
MATLTIELPDELIQQVHQRGISQQRLENVVNRMVQEFLRELDKSLPDNKASAATEPVWTDGETFARRMIANNRELFEELAQL